MFCKNCGKELLNGAKFCTVCGATQDTSVSNAAPSYQSPQPAAVNNDVYQALQAEANYQTYKKAKRRKNRLLSRSCWLTFFVSRL